MTQKITIYRLRDLGINGFDTEELFSIALTEDININIEDFK